MELSKSYDIKCISGVEVDAIEWGINFHILAYNFNTEDKHFEKFIVKNRNLLDEVSDKLVERMAEDHNHISKEDYENFTYDRSGGGWKAILAHPGKVILENDMDIFEEKLRSVISMGLDGIECYYPTHTHEITNICVKLCKENKIFELLNEFISYEIIYVK